MLIKILYKFIRQIKIELYMVKYNADRIGTNYSLYREER
jgi:hypothetical protein